MFATYCVGRVGSGGFSVTIVYGRCVDPQTYKVGLYTQWLKQLQFQSTPVPQSVYGGTYASAQTEAFRDAMAEAFHNRLMSPTRVS